MPLLSNKDIPDYVMASYIRWFLDFCDEAALKRFRHYENFHRIPGRLRYHEVTLIHTGLFHNTPIAYGHLDRDPDNGKLWLGICVVPTRQNRMHGTRMMQQLLNRAEDDVWLSLDKDNLVAHHLFSNYGFEFMEEGEHNLFMRKKLLTIQKFEGINYL
jgi:RimJ/RimL family protein N-acetyltransferase